MLYSQKDCIFLISVYKQIICVCSKCLPPVAPAYTIEINIYIKDKNKLSGCVLEAEIVFILNSFITWKLFYKKHFISV